MCSMIVSNASLGPERAKARSGSNHSGSGVGSTNLRRSTVPSDNDTSSHSRKGTEKSTAREPAQAALSEEWGRYLFNGRSVHATNDGNNVGVNLSVSRRILSSAASLDAAKRSHFATASAALCLHSSAYVRYKRLARSRSIGWIVKRRQIRSHGYSIASREKSARTSSSPSCIMFTSAVTMDGVDAKNVLCGKQPLHGQQERKRETLEDAPPDEQEGGGVHGE